MAQSQYENGDPYSPRYLRDGSPNPYNIGFKGYDFELAVPANYSTLNGNQSVVDV